MAYSQQTFLFSILIGAVFCGLLDIPMVLGGPLDVPVRQPPEFEKGHQPTDGENVNDGALFLSTSTDDSLLPCKATGEPKPTITWYRDTVKVDSGTTKENVKFTVDALGLHIDMTKGFYASSFYYCEAKNDHGTSVSSTVKVYYATTGTPGEKKRDPVFALAGEPAKLQCKAPKAFPSGKYSWYANTDFSGGKGEIIQVPTDARVSIDPINGDLYFAYLKKEDEYGGDIYQCQVYNPAANEIDFSSSGYKVNVNDANPIINAPFKFKDASGEPKAADALDRSLTFLSDGRYTLFCAFSGALDFTYEWSKDGSVITATDAKYYKVTQGGPHLELRNIDGTADQPLDGVHDGDYKCMVKKNNNEETMTASITVDVKEKPTMTTIPKGQTAVTGGSLTFKCGGKGDPKPTLEWLWNNGPLPGKWSNKAQTENDVSTITLDNLNRGGGCGASFVDSDIGVLQCKLSNTQRVDNKDETYTVIRSAFLNLVCPLTLITPAPSSPVTISQKFGLDIDFNIDWSSDPSRQPGFLWKIGQRNINMKTQKGFTMDPLLGNVVFETVAYDDSKKDKWSGDYEVEVYSADPNQSQKGIFKVTFTGFLEPRLMFDKPSKSNNVVTAKWKDKVVLPISYKSDKDAGPVNVTWYYDGRPVTLEPGKYELDKDGSLIIYTDELDKNDIKPDEVAGKYTCVIQTGHPAAQRKEVTYNLKFSNAAALATAGSTNIWWIAIVIACIIVIIIIVLLICMIRRNKGDSYYVDEKERKQGNDPEKDLKDEGFKDYMRQPGAEKVPPGNLDRPDDDNPSDDDSLAEYGDEEDAGKFNEDGSFIGQYGKAKGNKKAADSVV